jgi:hypothetical protein
MRERFVPNNRGVIHSWGSNRSEKDAGVVICRPSGRVGNPSYCKRELSSLLCGILDVLLEGEFVVEYDTQILDFACRLDCGVPDIDLIG